MSTIKNKKIIFKIYARLIRLYHVYFCPHNMWGVPLAINCLDNILFNGFG
jgi:hypothetical protein